MFLEIFSPLLVDLALKLFFLIFILLYFIFFGWGIWLLVILIKIKTFPESLPLDFCLFSSYFSIFKNTILPI